MITILGVDLYSMQETTELLGGITLQTLRSHIRKGKLTATIVGRKKYIPAESIKAYLTHAKTTENKG